MLEIFKPKKNTTLPLRSRVLLPISKASASLFPNISHKLLTNLLCKPKGRRDYTLRTKIQPQAFTIKTLMGEMTLYWFQSPKKNTKSALKNEVLLSHGWADSTIRFTQIIDHLTEQGKSVWSLDHVGHGKSEGIYAHLFSFREDLLESIKFIKDKTDQTPQLVGHSMGGLAVLTLDKNILNSTKVVLISMPTKFYENMFQRTFEAGIATSMLESLLDSVSKKYNKSWESLSAHLQTEKFKSNFLIIHDKDDEVCSYQNMKALTQNTTAHFTSTLELGHLKILKDKEVLKAVERFLN